MNNYIIIAIGWTIGQVLYALKKAWDLQKANASLDFKSAVKLMFTKETASWLVGLVALCAVLFALPDFLKTGEKNEAHANGADKDWHVWALNYIRLSSIAFGYICQTAVYAWLGKAQKIVDAEK